MSTRIACLVPILTPHSSLPTPQPSVPTPLFPLLLLALFATSGLGEEPPVHFSRQILPILSDHCFICHGPAEDKRQGDLRLDTEEGAARVLGGGDPAASELLKRVESHDPDEQMPPPDSNRALSEKQVELLRRWIREGGTWGKHWSFAPLERPTPPLIERAEPAVEAPVRNPIDAFVQQRLLRESVAPSPEAPRATLIRRVTLDLTGLPPTPDEVDAFVADPAPDAYERLVDRLLASPELGERLAWDWLDAARYADSNGYQGDRERTMWPWRDWVVDAFNRDLAYDQFTLWQLAGDLLPDATAEQRLATGFCRNHMINGEGGRIPEENRVDYIMDMTETTGTLWLGLTLNCCRCHDHKFDPLSQRDYYQLFAFFNQTPVSGGGGDPQTAPAMPVATSSQSAEQSRLEQQLATLRGELERRARELESRRPEWERRTLERVAAANWRPLRPTTLRAEHQELRLLEDDSVLAGGPLADRDTYTLVATLPAGLTRLTGLRLEALRDPSLTQGSLSRAESGNFVLTEVELSWRASADAEPQPLKIAQGEATFEQGALKIAGVFDGLAGTGWAVYEGKVVEKEHAAALRLDAPHAVVEGGELIVVLRHDSPHARHNLGRFRLSVSGAERPTLDDQAGELREALNTAEAERDDEQQRIIERAQRADDRDYSRLQAQADGVEGTIKRLRDSLPRVMVMEDMPQRRKTFLLSRGLYNQQRDEVDAVLPGFLELGAEVGAEAGAEPSPLNRLDLARWLIDPRNPLVARVTVNRVWQPLFGVGLVKTSEDFGLQGETPPHPELLDWLACELRDEGWDLKHLVRTIVTSHTYRQSSRVTPAAAEQDPENRLLARGARFRMSSWMLRDQALAVSGLLASRMGGPSVNTYQPPGVWEEATFGNKKYTPGQGEDLYRRSLYVFWRRIIGPTMFFDNASRQTCTVKMFRTNTPLHALLTLNETTYVEAARTLAEHALQGEGDDMARLTGVFRRVLGRAPTDGEARVLLAGLARTRDQCADDRSAAEQLLGVGDSPRDKSLDSVEHASWTALCLAVLNLDETLTKE